MMLNDGAVTNGDPDGKPRAIVRAHGVCFGVAKVLKIVPVPINGGLKQSNNDLGSC